MSPEQSSHVAVIGMAGRFPGARSVGELWANLCAGLESIRFFSDDELLAAGVPPALLAEPSYVKARGVLDDVDLFDAGLFDFTPRDAEITDPQQRLFLECAWEALESAGYDPSRFRGRIGVFAGTNFSGYLYQLISRGVPPPASDFELEIGNDKDYLATRVSYKLDLRGPSITVQTTCSTSLVATHLAVQSLLSYECDIALAGGVSIARNQISGELYLEGGVVSPDGHCRAFDARARGTVNGSGLGMVVLRRLDDALAVGDPVRAVLRGSAVNNDGAAKVGFTAPSIAGQAQVIAEALAMAGLEPSEISYVEAHGTGTTLGDPVEVEALRRAFGDRGRQTCHLGTIKTNIGHLNSAAGVAGLIKTVLMLENRKLVPSLHFESPNPQIDFANSPFRVCTEYGDWTSRDGVPRRAGVSSFGLGGTNSHVVLEEAPALPPRAAEAGPRLLILSARTPGSLERMTQNLARDLERRPELDLGDVAHTLQIGRRQLAWRCAVVASSSEEAVRRLAGSSGAARRWDGRRRSVAFLFPGQGTQTVGMGAALARAYPSFREDVDRCAGILRPLLGRDLRDLLFSAEAEREEASRLLGDTYWAQPALFVVEYALARLWIRWGVQPRALLGHSVGELVAACLSGVFELPEALTLIASRGRLLQALPGGAMLSVALPREEVEPLLEDLLSIAAVNGPAATVVAGAADAIERLRRALELREVGCRPLQVGHAFHSTLVEPAMVPWMEEVRRAVRQAPRIPIVSNVTGAFLAPEDAMNPGYWGRHLRETVRFSEGLETLFSDPEICLLEVGPGETLARLARRHPGCGSGRAVVSSLAGSEGEEDAALLRSVGRLWCEGVEVDWEAFSGGKGRRRVLLPTYPFEHQRYWIGDTEGPTLRPVEKGAGLFLPVWKSSPPPAPFVAGVEPRSARSGWLLFSSGDSLSAGLAARLEAAGEDVVVVTVGDRCIRRGDRAFALRCDAPSDYDDLFRELRRDGRTFGHILHLWCAAEEAPPGELLARGFGSLVALARAIAGHDGRESIRLTVVSSAMQKVAGEPDLCAEKATLLGPCRAISRELSQVACRSVDVELPPAGSWQEARMVGLLLAETAAGSEPGDAVIAYRDLTRWVLDVEPVAIPEDGRGLLRLHQRGVYLITGATSAAGLAAARFLARTVRARLILAGSREIVSSPVLLELEEAGAEVIVAGLEDADGEGLLAVLAAARKRFGAVQGAIHAEEGPGEGPLRLLDPERAVRALAARMAGVRRLDELLCADRPDFVVLVGSARSMVGRGGLAERGAGDAFLDAFAAREATRREMPVLSLRWSDRLSDEEGAELFGRALSSTVPQLVAALGDFREPEAPTADGKSAAAAPASHDRPDLEVLYVAPRDETERMLAELWQEIFRIDRVGIHDDFFALGGDSLVGVQMSARALRRGLRFSPRQLFELPTIGELALRIETVGDQSAAVDATPFSLTGVERTSLDELLGDGREIEDAYPLSPLQQGLHFHALFDPGSGDYMIQVECELHGDLRVEALKAAWERVVDRFAVLRTSFLWQGLRQPLQIVRRRACPAWEERDWRGLEERELRERKEALLRTDRARGFDLSQVPLTRFALLRTADDVWCFLWTFHHVLLDAWSEALVLSEVFAAYREIVEGTGPVSVRPAIPFSRYIAWLRRQDLGRVEAFWRESLRGLAGPTLVPAPGGDGAGRAGYEKLERRLETGTAELVQAFLRGRRMTLNTLAQGALTLLLGHLSGRSDVVFGLTVSGRPPELAEVESIAGLFINTLPLRVRLPEQTSAVEWLEALQDRLIEIQRYEHSPLVEIQKWSELPNGVALFEVISTFENAPRSPVPPLADLGLEIRAGLHAAQNSNPLTVLVVPGPEIQVGMLFDRQRCAAADVEKWLDAYTALLRGLAERPEAPLGLFLADLETAARTRRQAGARGFAEASRQRLQERIGRLGGIVREEGPETGT
jgi:acyl transferase domain-containing protein